MDNYKEKAEIALHKPGLCLSIIDLMLGKKLGSGTTRDVYEFAMDKDKWVVKIEKEGVQGDNWAEWRVWGCVAYTTDGTKDWFAECDWISDDGRVMLQRRTQPLETRVKKIPERIPAYFTDVKLSNFGWIGNQMVCHDYSLCIERFSFFALKKSTRDFRRLLTEDDKAQLKLLGG